MTGYRLNLLKIVPLGYNFSMKFYYSKKLAQSLNLTHAFTTKSSGNLAFHVDDNEANVQSNHLKLAKELGYEKISYSYETGSL